MRHRRKLGPRGKMVNKKIVCPYCRTENVFRVKKFPFSVSAMHKTHRHCKNCGAEYHITNYEGNYWHPVKKGEKKQSAHLQSSPAGK